MLTLILLACTAKDTPSDTTAESGDTGAAQVGPGIVMLAGGGTEGEVGDASAWSARLYPQLWAGGDVTGDRRVQVVILSMEKEDEWLPEYFESLGVDDAFNLRVNSVARADDDELVDTFAAVDAVFIKGGDQGEYYDTWNGTLLEEQIRLVHETRGGGVGGTSAGAMSQSEYALAGGMDYVTGDVLADSDTEYLGDTSDGGSGIHDDFLGFLPGYVVDTHFTQRARLGRMIGAMAKAWEDFRLTALRGIGCEEQTGVYIRDGVATVVGVGAVSLVTADGSTAPQREAGVPLTWEGLRLDRLTDGWRFDVGTGAVDTSTPPSGAEAVAWDGFASSAAGQWYADGDYQAHEERFAWVVERDPSPYAEHEGMDRPVLGDAIGVMNAFDSDLRASAEEAMFRGLYDHIGATGFLIGYGGSAQRSSLVEDVIDLTDNPEVNDDPMATMLVDTSGVSWRSLSPEASLSDLGDGSLHSAGLVGATVHILYTPASALAYDTVARAVVTAP